MLRCDVCDSSNISQQITAMVDANEPIIYSNILFDYDDFYFCEECGDECKPIEDKDDAN